MDNESYKICPKCGTACEPDHAFCSKCGNSFAAEEYNKGYGRPTYYKDTLDGVPTAEVVDYIDRNSYSYLPKFFKYSNGAKAGWNWPVFVLGLFGLPFVWFFYRKMYKAGFIVLAISLAIVLGSFGALGVGIESLEKPMVEYLSTVYDIQDKYGISGDIDDLYDFDDYYYDDGFDGYDANDDGFEKEMRVATQKFINELLNNETFRLMSILMQLLSYLQMAFTIVLPIFSNYIYYKKAMRDLKMLNEDGYPNGYTVQTKGGVKTWAAVLSGIGGYLLMIIGGLAVIMPFIMSIVNTVIERFTIV